MELKTASAPAGEIKGKRQKKRCSMTKRDCDLDYSDSQLNPKKRQQSQKISSDTFFDNNKNSDKYLKYKNTSNYTSVFANPSKLPSTPQIFRKNNVASLCNNAPDSFLYNVIPVKSFNTNVNQRFDCISLLSQEKLETNEELNRTSNDHDKGDNRKKKKRKKHHKSESDSIHNESILSEIKSYKAKENRGVVFHMHQKSSFTFLGEIKVTVLSGEIEILGYTLSHSSSRNAVDAYSPNFYSPLVIETKLPNENKSKTEVENLLQDYLSEKDVKSILTDFNADDAVIFIEQINSITGVVINKYADNPLFPKDLEDVESEYQTVKSVQAVFNFKLSPEGKHFKKNPDWDNIPLGGCTVLCGGKGVGKTTLLKYYINKLLAQGEKVLCLDLDVGQPEFTAGGCVSAVVVDQPLLGPNFTHMIEPALMMYFGDVDVAQNPSRYLECVRYVIESCKKNVEFCRMNCFVNTMGFSKGLGVYLTITILKLLQPNTVIQIQDNKNDYPFFLTPTNLNSRAGFKSMPLEDVQVSHDLRIVKSYAVENEGGNKGVSTQGGLKPRQLRDVISLAYFSKTVSPPYYNFNAVQPYLISFSKLYLGIYSLINFNDILKAFNANIVSLLNFEPDSEEIYSVDSDENDYFKIVVKPKLTPCLGLGLVRGIDCKEQKLYLITHLPEEKLNQVNCLSLERISPPHSMFLKQETVDGHSVYTTVGTANLIQRVKRMFHGSANPNRERFNV